MPLRLICGLDDEGRRLDRILRKALPDMPLSALHRLLRKGKITLDDKKALPESRVKAGQIIEIQSRLLSQADYGSNITPQFQNGLSASSLTRMNIIYEGSGILILNKPAGIAVHGPKSLAQEVYAYLAPKLPPSLSFKPGPLHRLDKPTSGLIMFSTSLEGARFFSAMHKNRRIIKKYLAIVDGIIKRDEVWEDCLVEDKKSITRIKVQRTSGSHTLILAEIEAGKKHQIRSQASLHGHPLSGDKKYKGSCLGFNGFFLHAWKLELCDPALCDQAKTLKDLPKEFKAPLPVCFEKKINELFGEAFSKEITQRR